MISADLARSLALVGLRWHPAPGDRFTIEADDLGDVVYTVSELTVEVHEYPTGTILGFNGTTEWALDSVDMDQTLWLPAEKQLRSLLGEAFVSPTRAPASTDATASTDRLSVTIMLAGQTVAFTADDASEAYGEALHALISAALAL
jgi:hypothetical protein